MLKAGVLGAGHLGKIHLKLLQQSERYDLVGFYDANPEHAAQIEADLGYKYFSDIDELIAACDMIDVVTPTSYHHESGVKVLEAGKHLFIEKPITVTVEEANELISLSR
ncbi:MAG: Gfo/Idh/MocA family oxidoreductase, partial [Nonlabens sp.]